MTSRPSVIETDKTIPETLADLRQLFRKYQVEDWEPIPGEQDRSYAVRYRLSGQWQTISSHLQPSKDQNLRQCYQVIRYLFIWADRGVSGVSKGVTFIHGGIVRVDGASSSGNELAEAYASLGVDPDASDKEIDDVYRAKIRHAHPDHAQDDEDRQIRQERTQRLNHAKELIERYRKNG